MTLHNICFSKFNQHSFYFSLNRIALQMPLLWLQFNCKKFLKWIFCFFNHYPLRKRTLCVTDSILSLPHPNAAKRVFGLKQLSWYHSLLNDSLPSLSLSLLLYLRFHPNYDASLYYFLIKFYMVCMHVWTYSIRRGLQTLSI